MKQLLPVLVLLSMFIVVSCGKSTTGSDTDSGGTNYTVSVSVAPSGGGSVSPAGSKTYEKGKNVQLQASANEGYRFAGWTGDMESSTNPLSLTVDQNYSLTANFEIKTYELTVDKEGEGMVNEKVIEQKSKRYEQGTIVELTATPAKGYKFVEWTGDVTGTGNPVQITVDNPKEVTAVFEKKDYPLTVTTQGEGAVSEQVVQQKTTDYKFGDKVELTASPAKGWKFTEWQGDITGSNNPVQMTIDDTTEVTAVFEKKSYTLNISVTGEGTLTKNPDQEEYAYESTVDLEANPAEGWSFVEWQGDVSSADTVVTVTVDTTKTITAVFESNFAGGIGTAADPYEISTIEQLQKINSTPEFRQASYVQINDIDASTTAGWNRGEGFIPISFSGTYDGQGYKILNLTVDRNDRNNGLFGVINQAHISNIKLINADISGDGFTGGLVGSSIEGYISDSFVTGTVHCTDTRCGGLAGESYGPIENSYADVEVSSISSAVGGLVGMNAGTASYCYALGNVTGIDQVGGLVGLNISFSSSGNTGEILTSYAQGEVTGKDYIGGLAGLVRENTYVRNSYATGKVSPSTSGSTVLIGGLVGRSDMNSSIAYCYWDTEGTGQTEGTYNPGSSFTSANTGLTTSEMSGDAAKTNMSEYDFVSIWQTVSNGYPMLFWQ